MGDGGISIHPDGKNRKADKQTNRFTVLSRSFRYAVFRPAVSVGAGLLVAALMMLAAGYKPLAAYAALWSGATGLAGGPASPGQITIGSGHLDSFQLAQSLAHFTPLLLCGIAVAIPLRAGLFNIGGQGQMTVGALAASWVGSWTPSFGGSHGLPPAMHIPLTMVAGVIAGGLWGAFAGFLHGWRGVHEVISTIMLNYIGLDIVGYLAATSLRDPDSQNLQTVEIAHSAVLQPIIAHSSLTAGLFGAVAAALAATFLIRRTSLGFRIRAVGSGVDAARAAGVPVEGTVTMTLAIAGGLAGLAGAIEVMGVQHRFVDGIAGGYGFDGIAVALLGGVGPLLLVSALFFACLASGAAYMESVTNVPAPISVIVQAVVIVFAAIRYVGPHNSSETVSDVRDEPGHVDATSIAGSDLEAEKGIQDAPL